MVIIRMLAKMNKMNAKSILFTSSIIFILITFIGCSKKECKECYLIEEDNGAKYETSKGKLCGKELEDFESQVWVASSGTAYSECR